MSSLVARPPLLGQVVEPPSPRRRKIQALGRRRVLVSVVFVQHHVRAMIKGRTVRRRFLQIRHFTVVLQRWARTRSLRERFLRLRQHVRLLQRAYRGMRARHETHELRTASETRAQQDFLEMHFERERLWLALAQQQLYEADLETVRSPLCVDFALEMDDVYPQGWSRVFAELVTTGGAEDERLRHVRAISCGATSTAVLFESGELWTFGWGDNGQLGQSAIKIAPRPQRVSRFQSVGMGKAPSDAVYVKMMASGDEHVVLVSDTGVMFAFGSNDWGQLGTGKNLGAKNASAFYPRVVKTARPAVDVAACAAHSAAVLDGGTVLTWGSWNRQRPVPDAAWTPRRPHSAPNTAKTVQCGRTFVAVVGHSGEVWTWGANDNGQLGLGRPLLESVAKPTRVVWAPAYHRAPRPGPKVGPKGRTASSPALLLSSAAPPPAPRFGSSSTERAGALDDGMRVLVAQTPDSPNGACLGRVRKGGSNPVLVELDDSKQLVRVPRAQLFLTEPLRVKELAVGARHCVGITTGSAVVVAWGCNKDGQIGSFDARDGGSRDCCVPDRVMHDPTTSGTPVKASAGLRHSVMVTKSPDAVRVLSWGRAGCFRFVSPVQGNFMENTSRTREPELSRAPGFASSSRTLASSRAAAAKSASSGIFASPDPAEVARWRCTDNPATTPSAVSVATSFSRTMSVSVLTAQFECDPATMVNELLHPELATPAMELAHRVVDQAIPTGMTR